MLIILLHGSHSSHESRFSSQQLVNNSIEVLMEDVLKHYYFDWDALQEEEAFDDAIDNLAKNARSKSAHVLTYLVKYVVLVTYTLSCNTHLTCGTYTSLLYLLLSHFTFLLFSDLQLSCFLLQ